MYDQHLKCLFGYHQWLCMNAGSGNCYTIYVCQCCKQYTLLESNKVEQGPFKIISHSRGDLVIDGAPANRYLYNPTIAQRVFDQFGLVKRQEHAILEVRNIKNQYRVGDVK